jgi:di/tricarboxylate transporter
MKILADPLFTQFGLPLITVILSVFLKFVTRNDQHTSFQKEDLAFGIDLSITALLLFIASCPNIVKQSTMPSVSEAVIGKVNSIPWILLSVMVGIWGVSTLIRKLGWEEAGKLHIIWGISIPNIFGIFVLLFVVYWIRT